LFPLGHHPGPPGPWTVGSSSRIVNTTRLLFPFSFPCFCATDVSLLFHHGMSLLPFRSPALLGIFIPPSPGDLLGIPTLQMPAHVIWPFPTLPPSPIFAQREKNLPVLFSFFTDYCPQRPHTVSLSLISFCFPTSHPPLFFLFGVFQFFIVMGFLPHLFVRSNEDAPAILEC